MLQWAKKSDEVMVLAISQNWQFPIDWQLPVAMRMGDTSWIGDGDRPSVFHATGNGNVLSFSVNQSVTDWLRNADRIEVKSPKDDLSISLNHAKMETLLSHTSQCRGQLK